MLPEELEEVLKAHKYELLSPIGSGGYGSCYIVKSQTYNITFVVKIIDAEKEHTFYQELDALRKITHPHILKLYDYFKEGKWTFLVNEYCSQGNLYAQVHDKTLSTSQIMKLAREIANALDFCHKKGIAHLDVKPSNIFIDSFGRTKLADFGLATFAKNHQHIEQFKGSIAYCAPEIIEKKPFDPFKADVWAFGMTVFHIANGSLPWMTEDPSELRVIIPYGIHDIQESIEPFLKQILLKCFNNDPELRPSMSQIVEMLEQPVFPTIHPNKPIKVHGTAILAQPNFITKAKARAGSLPRIKLVQNRTSQLTNLRNGNNDSLPKLKIPKPP